MSGAPAGLVTVRLGLLPLTAVEAAALLVGDRDGQRWAPGYPTDGDLDAASMVLAAGEAAEPLLGPLRLRTADGTVVGGAGFLGPPDVRGDLRLGYCLAPSVRGRGLATEAVRALVDHARTVVAARRVLAETAVDNHASQRVLARSGFSRLPDLDPGLQRYAITLG